MNKYDKFLKRWEIVKLENCVLIEDYDDLYPEDLNNIKTYYEMLIAENPRQHISTIIKSLLKCINDCVKNNFFLVDAIKSYNAYISYDNSKNIIQNYFEDVQKCYEDTENEELEFNKVNREKLIKQNLRMVISTAKRYRGMDVPLEDLISAGNEGLCVAFDKFNPKGSKVYKKIHDVVGTMKSMNYTIDEIDKQIGVHIKYGSLRTNYEKYFYSNPLWSLKDIKKWVKLNIKHAKFSSAAAFWIKAYILQSVNNARLVKRSKNDLDKEKDEHGAYPKEIRVDICGTDDDSMAFQDKYGIFIESEISLQEKQIQFDADLESLLEGVSVRDKRILLKYYGITGIKEMSSQDIAASEGLTNSRISQILKNSLKIARKNANKYDIKVEELFKLIEK